MDKHVYIVEDDAWLRDLFSEVISLQPGLAVCGAASTGEEALKALPAGADVVMVDLGLGLGISGLEVVEAVRERWPSLPCVVVSARGEDQVRDAVQAAGAVGYVEKGDQEGLFRALQQATAPVS